MTCNVIWYRGGSKSQILITWSFSTNYDFSPWIRKENYTSAWSSNSFPGTTSLLGFIENCPNFILMSHCSPIHGTIPFLCWSTEQICLQDFKHFRTLYAGLENNGTSECISDSLQAPWHDCCSCKIVRTPFQCVVFLQSRGQSHGWC